MELARDLRARQSTFKYIQKYAPENYVPPKEQRFSVKRIHTLVAYALLVGCNLEWCPSDHSL